MKIFTKIMLIIAGVFATVGVICMVVAFAMGLTTNQLKDMVQDGDFSISLQDGETKIYEIEEPCNNLDVEFGAGIFDIYYDDVENIQVKETNISELNVNVKNDTLVIGFDGELEIGMDDIEDRNLTVIIPKEMQFKEVDLEIGASQADIRDIVSEEISITVGAGQADISKLTAKQLDLEVGAGQAMAVQLSVDKLDIEAGLGEVNVALNGVQEEYNYTVECGIGSVVVGKSSYSGLGAEQSVKNEGATKEINVECGIGEVIIKFKE